MVDPTQTDLESLATQVCIVCEKPFKTVKQQQMCEHCITVLSLCTKG